MDGIRFDNLTRSLVRGTTRRGVLKGLGGGLAAVFGLTHRPASAQQTKRPLCHATGDPANPWVVIEVAEPAWDTHVAHGDTPFVDCCADADCSGGQRCDAGACVCPSGTTDCQGNCVATCPAGQTLNPSTCACEPVACIDLGDPCSSFGDNCCGDTSVCGGATACCTRTYEACDPADDHCCRAGGQGGCVAFGDGHICCGRSNVSPCPAGCTRNASCAGCCDGWCGSSSLCAAVP